MLSPVCVELATGCSRIVLWPELGAGATADKLIRCLTLGMLLLVRVELATGCTKRVSTSPRVCGVGAAPTAQAPRELEQAPPDSAKSVSFLTRGKLRKFRRVDRPPPERKLCARSYQHRGPRLRRRCLEGKLGDGGLVAVVARSEELQRASRAVLVRGSAVPAMPRAESDSPGLRASLPNPPPQAEGTWRPCPPPGGSLHTGLRANCASIATEAGLYMELAIRRRSSSGSSARFSSAGVIGVSPRTSPSSASRFSFTVAFPPKKYFTRRVSYARGLHSSGRARRYPQLASNASVTCCSLITADCKAGCLRSARSWCCYSSSKAWQ